MGLIVLLLAPALHISHGYRLHREAQLLQHSKLEVHGTGDAPSDSQSLAELTSKIVNESNTASGRDYYIPPGSDANVGDGGGPPPYEEVLADGFWCPPRLRGRNSRLVDTVNDWHFAMLNDANRNDFYWNAMKGVVEGKRVIDIGAGSGLLSLMAAKLGAREVLAIEASRDMADLAELNAKHSGLDHRVNVVHSLSNEITLDKESQADVLVSETLGTLMLGEGTLDYFSDARKHLARPGATVIPAGGSQYAMLVSSESIATVSSVREHCEGLNLSAIGSLQDTTTVFFTKQYGFRLNSLPDVVQMSDRINILTVDFHETERRHIPQSKTFSIKALRDGVVHAVVASFEVWSDPQGTHRMTTHPEDTKDQPWGFARDMQWGQGIQVIEDLDAAEKSERNSPPAPFIVKAGETLLLTANFSPNRQTFQFTLRRDTQN